MKKTLIALSTSVILTGNAVASDIEQSTAQRNEAIGLSSGLISGAILGGPIGAILGGVFGVMLADDINDRQRLEAKQHALQLTEAQLIEKQNELFAAHKSLSHYRQKASQLAALQQDIDRLPSAMQSNIQFRTASHALEQHYHEQLDRLADTLVTNPALTISLTGYADQRGDDTYNQALSEQRVISVKQYLLGKGVNESQVVATARGEQELVSTGQSFEDDFFDRRVVLSVSGPEAGMMAANPQE